MEKIKNASQYLEKHEQWRDILTGLRRVLNSTDLEETIKWGMPVYTLDGKNVVGLAAFKQHAAIWFYQGALLKDKSAKLVNAQEGKTHSLRQWRFKIEDVVDTALVSAYVNEAITNQKQGKVVKAPPPSKLIIPTELEERLAADRALDSQFRQLPPYKQKQYAEFVSSAKKAETRLRRLEKCTPLILDGRGLYDAK